MDFAEELAALAARAPRLLDNLKTEAATATSLVLPFIRALGYDPFDPSEVVPEFAADVGTKRGEKVDFAIMREGEPCILVEVKHHSAQLDVEHASQLYRYFSVTKARFGVLTNGITYRLFTDLEEPNKMDERPFLEFSLLELRESTVEALKRFTRSRFHVDHAVSAATDLKYTNGIKAAIVAEFSNPSDEMVRLLAKPVYGGNLTAKARDTFRDIIRRAHQQVVNETLAERLQGAVRATEEAERAAQAPVVAAAPPAELAADGGQADDGIVTTPVEIQAFHIVQAIAAEVVDPARIVMRDAKSYCAILFDDNNRKPVCRLYFASKLRVGFIGADKAEEKIGIEAPRDLYQHAARIRETVRAYLGAT